MILWICAPGKRESHRKSMEAGGTTSSRRLWLGVLLLGLLSGCASDRLHLHEALLGTQHLGAKPADVATAYQVSSPDVLAVSVAGRPDLSGEQPIAPDGCIRMGNLGRMRVEGQTV